MMALCLIFDMCLYIHVFFWYTCNTDTGHDVLLAWVVDIYVCTCIYVF